MAYYPNPFLAQLAQQAQHQRRYQHAQPGHYAHAHHPFATPQFNFYAPSPAAASAQVNDDHYDSYSSIEDEERAAIAHLRAIQRRKEIERIQRQQEAEIVRREAIRAQAQAQRERELAVLQAYREREIAQAKAERERELARRIEVARQAEIGQHRRQLLHAAAVKERQQQAINEQRRRQCARQCARRSQEVPAQSQAQTGSNPAEADIEAFNKWIGSLFGLQLPTETTTDAAAPAATEQTPTTAPTSAPAPAPAAVDEKSTPASTPTPVAEKAAPSPSPAVTEKKPEFPEAINDLLSNFLGLRVEPDSKLGEVVSNKVPAGLNELLGQFGLEFFPDEAPEAEKEKKEQVNKEEPAAGPSTSAAPAPAPTPAQSRGPVDLADFLKGAHGLPPFVRDILGNVELALKDKSEAKEVDVEVEGKGKGVAEGERRSTPTPAPAPAAAPTPTPAAPAPTTTSEPATEVEAEVDPKKASSESLAQLDSIKSEIDLAKSQFTFPTSLLFSTTPSDSPSLLYNKQNKPYHAQNNRLLQLLLAADGVASNGDREVRRKRKEIVKLVEGEIEKLEKKRDEYWEEVRERREVTGEVSEGESWATSSSADQHEHEQENENENNQQETVHVEDVAVPNLVDEETKESTDKPSFAEAVKSTEPSAPESDAEEPKQDKEVPEKEEKKSDKEEGYELL